MPIPFTKMQGAGNDFVVVSGAGHDWSTLAPALCARHFGVGSDGLLVALPSQVADVRMRMFNPDGTEDECGNGMRCLALYARDRGLVPGDQFLMETLSGIKDVNVVSRDGAQALVSVALGAASLSPASIPALFPGDTALGEWIEVDGEQLEIFPVSTGTAHTVIFEMPDEERFQRLSPLIEVHPAFPERTSIMWADVVDPDTVRIRIWERGAGETLACGTGASAVAVAAHVTGLTCANVRVESRGGALQIEVGHDLEIRKTGPAAFVFEGEFAV